MNGDVAMLFQSKAGELDSPAELDKVAKVTEQIRRMIIQDQLQPGSAIRERQLADKLGVSRTPMREALKVLAAEGLVDLHPNRGAVVAAPSKEEVFDILQLLAVVEGFAAELACERVTEAELGELWALHYEMLACHARGNKLGYFDCNQGVHLGIVRAARNQALAEHHRMLNARAYRIRFICNQRSDQWEGAVRDHEEILAALQRRDKKAASEAQRSHVFGAWERIAEIML
jgi:DNA-binding GntR family transcriptional regulator